MLQDVGFIYWKKDSKISSPRKNRMEAENNHKVIYCSPCQNC